MEVYQQLHDAIVKKIDGILLKFEALGKPKPQIPAIELLTTRSKSNVCRLDFNGEIARFYFNEQFFSNIPQLHAKCKLIGMIVELISLLYFGDSRVENVRYIESIIIKEKL